MSNDFIENFFLWMQLNVLIFTENVSPQFLLDSSLYYNFNTIGLKHKFLNSKQYCKKEKTFQNKTMPSVQTNAFYVNYAFTRVYYALCFLLCTKLSMCTIIFLF